MVACLLMNKQPRLCAISLAVISIKSTRGFRSGKKSSLKNNPRIKHSMFLSFLNAPYMNKINNKFLWMGFNNNIDNIIYLLHQSVEEGRRPLFNILHLLVNSLSDAQNKEGLVLASMLAHRHFPYHHKHMKNYDAFEPVEWSFSTLNKSLSHFENMYAKAFPSYKTGVFKSCVGRTFRSSLLSCYLAQEMTAEFLDLYYFVNDVFIYWKDVVPFTALWEILFCSPREEDQEHAINLLKEHGNIVSRGMRSCLLSLILTLASVADSRSLLRLSTLIKNKTINCRAAQRIYPNLKQLIIDMKYKEGRLDESILLIASSRRQCSLKKNHALKLDCLDNFTYSNYITNPKLYFINNITAEEAMMIPISLLSSVK